MTCDESLYRQYLSGDDEGLNALMKKYGDPLTLYIDGYLHDVHEAEELNQYPHSLFVADFAVTHTVNWNALNDASLIFGKNYAAGGVDYMLRAPSAGSDSTGSGESQRGTPQSNEWDKILDKDGGYIKNWNEIYSWGQDTNRGSEVNRVHRG